MPSMTWDELARRAAARQDEDRRNGLSPEERYCNSAVFKQSVDTVADWIERGWFTAGDIRAIAELAIAKTPPKGAPVPQLVSRKGVGNV